MKQTGYGDKKPRLPGSLPANHGIAHFCEISSKFSEFVGEIHKTYGQDYKKLRKNPNKKPCMAG